LTDDDEMLVRLLYSPRLTVGIPRPEALKIVRESSRKAAHEPGPGGRRPPTLYITRIGLALGSGARAVGPYRRHPRPGGAGVKPDVICGTSIGALVGGVHLAGKLDVLEQWRET